MSHQTSTGSNRGRTAGRQVARCAPSGSGRTGIRCAGRTGPGVLVLGLLVAASVLPRLAADETGARPPLRLRETWAEAGERGETGGGEGAPIELAQNQRAPRGGAGGLAGGDIAPALDRGRPRAPVAARAGLNPAVNAAAAGALGQQAPAGGAQQAPAGGAQQPAPGGGQADAAAAAEDEDIRIDPDRPDLKEKSLTIAKGKIPIRDFLEFLADFFDRPVLVDSSDQQLLSREIEVVADLRGVNGEVVKALLETNKIRIKIEKLEDPDAPDDPARATEILKVENMAPTTPTGQDPKPIQVIPIDEIEESADELDPDQYITMVFTLEYIAPADAIDALDDLVSGTTTARGAAGSAAARARASSFSMVEVKNTQMLIITAKFGLLHYLQELLKLIDVPFKEPDRIVKIIQVEWADSTELANIINEFIQDRSSGRFGRFGSRGQRQVTTPTPTGAGAAAARSSLTGGQVDYTTKLIPDMRTNKIIVETYLPEDLEDIEMLLGELDIRYENRRLRTNIYQVRYLKAVEVAQDLQLLIEGAGGTGLSRTARGTRSTRSTRSTTGVPRRGTPLTPSGAGQPGTGAPQNEALPSLIVPHEPTNSLMIQAEPEDFDEILNILSKIDAKRRQVFLEAALVQVQSGSTLNYTIELIAGNPDDEATRGLFASAFGLTGIDMDTWNRVIPDLSTPGSVQGGIGALMHNGKFPALIQFFKTNSDSQILATPFIVADDNEENRIDILETRFVTNTSVQQNQTTLQQQTGEPAGISLAITPTISGSEKAVFLTMDLSVSAFQGAGTETTLPPKAENTMTSSVTVPDGQILVIGGLTRENKSKAIDKVPILGDIPILGKLFRSETTDQSKNNLYVFLRAHILTDEEFRDGLELTKQAQERIAMFDPDIQPLKFERPEVPRRRTATFPGDEDDVDWRKIDLYEQRSGRAGFQRTGTRSGEADAGAATVEDYNGGRSPVLPAPSSPADAPAAPTTEAPPAAVEATAGAAAGAPTAPAPKPAAGEGAPAEVDPSQVPLAPRRKLRGWFE